MITLALSPTTTIPEALLGCGAKPRMKKPWGDSLKGGKPPFQQASKTPSRPANTGPLSP